MTETDDFFVVLPANIDRKKASKIVSPLLFSSENPKYTLLVESPIEGKKLTDFRNFIESNLKEPYQIVSVLPYTVVDDEIKQVINTYRKDSIDLTKYILGTKILTFGRALYAITKSDDISVESFTDFLLFKTSFYSPVHKCYVFPCYDHNLVVGKNSWERQFVLKQLDLFLKSNVSLPRIKKLNLVLVNDTHEFFVKNSHQKIIAYDTETSGLNFMIHKIGCLTISFDGVTGYYLPWDKVDPKEFGNFIKPMFQIGSNLKFDAKMLVRHGVPRDCIHVDWDTVNAGHVINEMRNSNGLKAHSWIDTYFGGYDYELDEYIKKYNVKNYLTVPFSIMFPYATQDPIQSFQVYESQLSTIKLLDEKFPMNNRWNLLTYLTEIVFPSINFFIDVEYRGIHVSVEKLREVSKILEDKIFTAKKKFLDFVGVEINIESPEMLGTLFKNRGLPNYGTGGKKRVYLTNDSILEKWVEDGYQEAQLLSEYRKLSILQKTFVGYESDNSGIWKYIIHHDDGSYRIHSTFHSMLADSHRNRSSEPNLQNLPHHGELAKIIRSIYVTPSDDYYFGEWDGSGLQLRIVAMLSLDEAMRDAFINKGGDLHSVTARNIFNPSVTIEEFMKNKKKEPYANQRYSAKAANFSLVFNTSARSFAARTLFVGDYAWKVQQCDDYIRINDLSKSQETFFEKLSEQNPSGDKKELFKFSKYWAVAEHIKKEYFKTYKGVKSWIANQIEFARVNGYVRSPFGAIRRLPQLLFAENYDDKRKIKNLENIAVNSPVQAVEVFMINRTLIQLGEYLKEHNLKSVAVGNVHDSGPTYIYKEELAEVTKVQREFFSEPLDEYQGIPMVSEMDYADYSKGEVWGYGQEYI